MGVEQEDQLHQDRRRVGLLGAKVEHRHDVALIVTAHRESDPGGQRALVREDHVTEDWIPIPTCRSPPGGVAATLVPRTTDWHLWEVGAPTRWNRTRRRCTGSMSRSMWRSALELSRRSTGRKAC